MRAITAALLAGLLAGCAADEKPVAVPTAGKAECRRANGPIKLDGQLDEKAWQKAQPIRDFAVFWEKRKARTATEARLLWDDDHLYFAAQMEDKDLYALEKKRNGMTWEDDVFELFFKPDGARLGYYEFQVSALGTQLELALPSRGSGGFRRFASAPALGMESAVKRDGTLNDHGDRDSGWMVEGRIPWKAFRMTGGRPRAGASWKFALCRYDYSVFLDRTELSSCAPLTRPDFHRYEDYGELLFVGGK